MKQDTTVNELMASLEIAAERAIEQARQLRELDRYLESVLNQWRKLEDATSTAAGVTPGLGG